MPAVLHLKKTSLPIYSIALEKRLMMALFCEWHREGFCSRLVTRKPGKTCFGNYSLKALYSGEWSFGLIISRKQHALKQGPIVCMGFLYGLRNMLCVSFDVPYNSIWQGCLFWEWFTTGYITLALKFSG